MTLSSLSVRPPSPVRTTSQIERAPVLTTDSLFDAIDMGDLEGIAACQRAGVSVTARRDGMTVLH